MNGTSITRYLIKGQGIVFTISGISIEYDQNSNTELHLIGQCKVELKWTGGNALSERTLSIHVHLRPKGKREFFSVKFN